ncbi:MAG: nuclear transport factor 2 family protein [candidate division Zixibacteria bacterium]
METQSFVKSVFDSVDAKDANKFISFLTDDATFKFANMEAVVGKDNVKQAVAGFFGSINGMSHKIHESFDHNGTIVNRGEVTYTRLDKSELTVPFANFFKMNGEKIKEYLIYVDASELYA